MIELFTLFLAGAAGAALGTIFFGGLWWTVEKGVSSKQPAVWFIGSRLLRMGIALVGFYFIGRGHWERMVACLIGFIIARFILMRLTHTRVEHPGSATKKVIHAP